MAADHADPLELLQEEIANCHLRHDADIRALLIERNQKKNAIYAERDALIKAKGPANFWSIVLRSHGEVREDLLGPYDEQVLDSLQSVEVQFTPTGHKLDMKFGPNDFFQERALSSEVIEAAVVEPSPEAAAADGGEAAAGAALEPFHLKFSGITWKDGVGPLSDDDEEDEEEQDEAPQAPKTGRAVASKRTRDESTGGDRRGPSMFTFFSELVHPDELRGDEEEEEEDEEEDEEREELEREYDETMDERADIMDCLVTEIYENPAKCLAGGFTSMSQPVACSKH